MRSYHATVLLPVFFCLITDVTDGLQSGCQVEQLMAVQDKCKDKNQQLLDAHSIHDDKLLCSSLYELWYCVADHVPVCLHNITDTYSSYTHSPHNCQISQEQMLTLQKLASSHGVENKDDVDIEIKPLTSPPNDVTSSGLPSSSEGDGGGAGGDTTEKTNVKGDTHSHTGTNGASTPACHRILLLMITWLVALQIT